MASAVSSFYRGLSLADISQEHKTLYENEVNPSTIYRWVIKYSREAVDTLDKLRMVKPSDVWVIDETVIKVNNRNFWFWDAIDQDTRFLLGSHLSRSRTSLDARIFLTNAYSRVARPPELILSDGLPAYPDAIEQTFGADTMHVRASPFTETVYTNLIELFHSAMKERTKVLRGFKTVDSARLIMEGFLVHYNFFRPHMTLKCKTPAEVAGIRTLCTTWLDVVKGLCQLSE